MDERSVKAFFRPLLQEAKHRERGWTARIVIRYVGLQLLGVAVVVICLILIRRWMPLPHWFDIAFLSFWIIKDMVLFPFVWRAYDWDRHGQNHAMVGLEGVVEDPLNPAGYIRIRGELWRAELMDQTASAGVGDRVKVLQARGLTLFVRPVTAEDKPS